VAAGNAVASVATTHVVEANAATSIEAATGSGPAPNAATPRQVATGSAGLDLPTVAVQVPPVRAVDARPSKCDPFRSAIAAQVEAGLTAQRIFQDLITDHGFAGAYNAVKRFVRRLRAGEELPFRRIECDPGAEAQIDFGTGAPVITGSDGKRRRTHVLRLVLSHSRKGYSEVFFRQTTDNLLACCENAFWSWSGVPKTLVIDNLKAAVLRADWYDPDLHPRLAAFCRHYGTVLLPTKVRTPRHKGKIEAGIKYVQSNALQGRVFDSLSAQNAQLAQWEARVADLRIHGTTKQQVAKVFETHERPALLPLPAERFPFFHEAQRVVHRDGHIEVERAYYSAPPEYMGRTVWVRWDSRQVRIFNTQFIEIALHARQEFGRFRTAPQHIASQKIALIESGATELLRRARLVGPQAARWAEAVLKERGIEGVRVVVGLLGLLRTHPSSAIERGCELALGHGAFRLRELRSLIKEPVEQQQLEFMAEHPVIRSIKAYGELVRVSFDQEEPWREPPITQPAGTEER
jgi:transposase